MAIYGWKAVIRDNGKYYSQHGYKANRRTEWVVGQSLIYSYPVMITLAGFHFTKTPEQSFKFMLLGFDEVEFSFLRVIGSSYRAQRFYSNIATCHLLPIAVLDLKLSANRLYCGSNYMLHDGFASNTGLNDLIYTAYQESYPHLAAKDKDFRR